MLAARIQPEGRRLELTELPEPEPGPGECVVAVAACGVCASDLRFLAGAGEFGEPRTLGHEAAGTVLAVGPGAARRPGEKVAVNPQLAPGEFIGIQHDGAFAERVLVPAANLVPLPDGADPLAAALSEPLSVAGHALGEGPPASLAVIGAGGIGLGAVLLARARGSERVLAVDVAEPARRRARACGAEALAPEEAAEAGPVDLVLDCTGAAGSLALAVELARPGGEVVLAGIAPLSQLPYEQVVRRQLRLRGAYAYTDAEFAAVATAIGAGRLDVGPVGAEARPLSGIAAAVEELREAPGAHSRLLIVPDREGGQITDQPFGTISS